MDAFIMPIAPFAAVMHNNFDHGCYTCMVPLASHKTANCQINMLDYTSCAVPVTIANKDIDLKDDTYQPVSAVDKRIWDKCKLSFVG